MGKTSPVNPITVDTSTIRWGIPREPHWVHGTLKNPDAGGDPVELVRFTVGSLKTGRIFGYRVATKGAAKQYSLYVYQPNGTKVSNLYLEGFLPENGEVAIVLQAPIIDNLAAGYYVTLETSGGTEVTDFVQGSLLHDEA